GQIRVSRGIRSGAARLFAGPRTLLLRRGFAAVQAREDRPVRIGLHVAVLRAVLSSDADLQSSLCPDRPPAARGRQTPKAKCQSPLHVQRLHLCVLERVADLRRAGRMAPAGNNGGVAKLVATAGGGEST